jgi:acetoin utilization protein AcuB
MLIKGWMTYDVITVREDTPMMKASIIMKEYKIRSLPVLNKKGKLGDRHRQGLKRRVPV